MAQVRLALIGIERVEVIARGDALCELAQFGTRELFAQLGLSEQDDLQQLLRRCFEVGQQTHLFERCGRQVLCLVDDQHHAQSGRVGFEQVSVECVHQRLDVAAAAVQIQPQFLADRLQQLGGRQQRIEDQCNSCVGRQLFEQQPADGRLAGADFAGQLDETAASALADAI